MLLPLSKQELQKQTYISKKIPCYGDSKITGTHLKHWCLGTQEFHFIFCISSQTCDSPRAVPMLFLSLQP